MMSFQPVDGIDSLSSLFCCENPNTVSYLCDLVPTSRSCHVLIMHVGSDLMSGGVGSIYSMILQ